MKKLNITNSARSYFNTLGVDVTNNAGGAVYMYGSMKIITAAISKILQVNPGVEFKDMSTATVKIVDEKTAIVNASVFFDLSGKNEANPEDE